MSRTHVLYLFSAQGLRLFKEMIPLSASVGLKMANRSQKWAFIPLPDVDVCIHSFTEAPAALPLSGWLGVT